MSSRACIMIGVIVGSTIGGFIPSLWGDTSLLSMSSVIFNLIGGLAGIFAGRWVYQNYF